MTGPGTRSARVHLPGMREARGSLTVRAKHDHVAALNPHTLRLKIEESFQKHRALAEGS